MAIQGNNILVLRNGTAIAGTVSNEIQSGSELLEISSPMTGDWKEYIAGRKEWSLNVSFLVTHNGDISMLLVTGTTYRLQIKPRNSSLMSVSGDAILKVCKITSTKGNLAQGSFQFVGTGPLE